MAMADAPWLWVQALALFRTMRRRHIEPDAVCYEVRGGHGDHARTHGRTHARTGARAHARTGARTHARTHGRFISHRLDSCL